MNPSTVAPVAAAVLVGATAWRHRPVAGPRVLVAEPVPDGWSWQAGERTRRVLVAMVLTVLAVAVSPVVAVAVAAGVAVRRVLVRRSVERRRRRALVDELPEVVDLLSLAVSAGLTVPHALRVVHERGSGALATQLGTVLEVSARGGSLADALDRTVDELGEEVRGLVRVVAGALRDGTTVAPALERLSDEVRVDRRRAAEERARRLPVQLLFPLVVCVLPAFALLTVVPLLAGSLSGLPW